MEDKILISNIKGKIAHSEKYYTTMHTEFLDPSQQAVAQPQLIGVSHTFEGGYEEAERKVLFIMPDE
ncbi:MAG: RNA-binding protein, partial [Eubacteriales bacterium]|nr:RNA-binding protein [Eubacteriales bacterium]